MKIKAKLSDPDERQRRRARRNEPHVRTLKQHVDRLRRELGCEQEIPYFDPEDGGVNARALLLLLSPGRMAVVSGFVSLDNDDRTAEKLKELVGKSGLDRKTILIWNAIPWYGGGKDTDAAPWLKRFGEILLRGRRIYKIRVVVLLGKEAQRMKTAVKETIPGAEILECPHPSPQSVRPENKNGEKILKTLRNAALVERQDR
jgi:hypothetical protein